MGSIKEINIKYRTYYFYNDIIDIKTFDSNNLKVDKKTYKDLNIYNIGYVTANKSRECMFRHYWYYLNKNFSYRPFTCDGCYNIVQRSTDLKNVAIIHVKKTAYRVYFKDISKHKAKKIMNKFNLVGKIIIVIIVIKKIKN